VGDCLFDVHTMKLRSKRSQTQLEIKRKNARSDRAPPSLIGNRMIPHYNSGTSLLFNEGFDDVVQRVGQVPRDSHRYPICVFLDAVARHTERK
jgi:hypothetical protein